MQRAKPTAEQLERNQTIEQQAHSGTNMEKSDSVLENEREKVTDNLFFKMMNR